jgi:rubrerythrin
MSVNRHMLTSALVALLVGLASSAAMAVGVTAANLQKAYEGETTASARYAKFAAKADAEGYHGVASLFRAASAAEKIHARNHAEAMKELGVKLRPFQVPPIKVGTTAENLRTAEAGETYEVTTMYPNMLAAAEKEEANPAIRSFTRALSTERAHKALYAEATKTLNTRAPKTAYYVCGICGMTLKQMPATVCPVCGFPKDNYRRIS